MYLSLGSDNPATTWLGTTWQKQEGRFLLGSSGSYSLGATGGASSIALSVANMPSHTHSASQSAHTHTQASHYHLMLHGARNIGSVPSASSYISSEGNAKNSDGGLWYSLNGTTNSPTVGKSANSGGDTTGSSTPSISVGATGSGTAFSIMPPYLVVNIWKRLS